MDTRESGRGPAPAVTRDVDPSTLADLLAHPPRATIAFIDGEQVDVVPVRARCRAGAYRFGIRPETTTDLAGREVVLVIDDGPYFFELRGISVRGPVRRLEGAEADEPDTLAWYAIEPRRVLAWSYAAMRET